MKIFVKKSKTINSVLAFATILALSSSCGIATNSSSLKEAASSWKGVLMAGYYNDRSGEAEAWDNATSKVRDLMGSLFSQSSSNFKRYTKDTKKLNSTGVDGEASLEALSSGLADSGLGADDACFIYITSHGSNDSGFDIENGRAIYPGDFFDAVEKQCGDRKTFAVISACYSGHFVDAAKTFNKPNMVVFSAAQYVPSFGCDASEEYTFYDQCMVDTLPNSTSSTYKELYEDMKTCITAKESQRGTASSNPQAYFGSEMGDEVIFSTSGSSSSADSSNVSGLYVNAAGSVDNLMMEISSPSDYDRIILCSAETAHQCKDPVSANIIRTADGKNVYQATRAMDLSVYNKLFIYGYKAGNTGSTPDVIRSLAVN